MLFNLFSAAVLEIADKHVAGYQLGSGKRLTAKIIRRHMPYSRLKCGTAIAHRCCLQSLEAARHLRVNTRWTKTLVLDFSQEKKGQWCRHGFT